MTGRPISAAGFLGWWVASSNSCQAAGGFVQRRSSKVTDSWDDSGKNPEIASKYPGYRVVKVNPSLKIDFFHKKWSKPRTQTCTIFSHPVVCLSITQRIELQVFADVVQKDGLLWLATCQKRSLQHFEVQRRVKHGLQKTGSWMKLYELFEALAPDLVLRSFAKTIPSSQVAYGVQGQLVKPGTLKSSNSTRMMPIKAPENSNELKELRLHLLTNRNSLEYTYHRYLWDFALRIIPTELREKCFLFHSCQKSTHFFNLFLHKSNGKSVCWLGHSMTHFSGRLTVTGLTMDIIGCKQTLCQSHSRSGFLIFDAEDLAGWETPQWAA